MNARPLVHIENLSKRFEVSAPWLQRLLNGEARQWVHAVSEVS